MNAEPIPPKLIDPGYWYFPADDYHLDADRLKKPVVRLADLFTQPTPEIPPPHSTRA